jgi:hypothetical protein
VVNVSGMLFTDRAFIEMIKSRSRLKDTGGVEFLKTVEYRVWGRKFDRTCVETLRQISRSGMHISLADEDGPIYLW